MPLLLAGGTKVYLLEQWNTSKSMRWLLGRFCGALLLATMEKQKAPEMTPGPETDNSSPPGNRPSQKGHDSSSNHPTSRGKLGKRHPSVHDSSHIPTSLPSTSHLTHFHPPHVSWDFGYGESLIGRDSPQKSGKAPQDTDGYDLIVQLGWYTWYLETSKDVLKLKTICSQSPCGKKTLQSKENLLDMILRSSGT